jgi:hypothetical protein
MTTRAKLSTNLPQGHGIQDTDAMYQALVDGKPVRPFLALVLLEPVATAQRKTAKGLHREVTCEGIRVEPVTDSNQAGELMWLLQKLYEQRTSTGAQRTLPLGGIGGDVEERRQEQMERMEAWAASEQLTGGELETRWRDPLRDRPGQGLLLRRPRRARRLPDSRVAAAHGVRAARDRQAAIRHRRRR